MILAASTTVIAAGLIGWWFIHDPAPQPVRLCEKEIQDRLKAPSSYQRRNFRITATPYDYNREEYINKALEVERHQAIYSLIGFDAQSKRQSIESRLDKFGSLYKDGYTYVEASVEFEAKNPMGVPIRNYGTCRWLKFGKHSSSDDLTWSSTDGSLLSLEL
jgi:hypothetical protein